KLGPGAGTRGSCSVGNQFNFTDGNAGQQELPLLVCLRREGCAIHLHGYAGNGDVGVIERHAADAGSGRIASHAAGSSEGRWKALVAGEICFYKVVLNAFLLAQGQDGHGAAIAVSLNNDAGEVGLAGQRNLCALSDESSAALLHGEGHWNVREAV